MAHGNMASPASDTPPNEPIVPSTLEQDTTVGEGDTAAEAAADAQPDAVAVALQEVSV